MTKQLAAGVVAGLCATLVLSMLMFTQSAMPQLDIITLLANVLRELGVAVGHTSAELAGWLVFVAIAGLWWGAAFGVMAPILPGRRCWEKGVYFGIGTALLLMLMVMPMAGAGYFGMHLEPIAPLVSFAFHLVYGPILGIVYAELMAYCPGPLDTLRA